MLKTQKARLKRLQNIYIYNTFQSYPQNKKRFAVVTSPPQNYQVFDTANSISTNYKSRSRLFIHARQNLHAIKKSPCRAFFIAYAINLSAIFSSSTGIFSGIIKSCSLQITSKRLSKRFKSCKLSSSD